MRRRWRRESIRGSVCGRGQCFAIEGQVLWRRRGGRGEEKGEEEGAFGKRGGVCSDEEVMGLDDKLRVVGKKGLYVFWRL